MRFRFSSFIAKVANYCESKYSKIKVVLKVRLDLFTYRVYFYNPMGCV